MSRMCENISDAMVLWKHLLNVVKANDKWDSRIALFAWFPANNVQFSF
jgi:cytochrome c-type biogenesis protein CcmH/NrfG